MKFLSFSGAKHLGFACCCIILIGSCGKEPLDIRDVPFEDLESSYYELAPNSIEVPHSVIASHLISKDDLSISFSSSDILESVKVGDIIVSSIDAPPLEFICRKVLEVNNNGGTINFSTKRATIVEAYDSFYFNSEKQNVIQVRNETKDITTLFNSIEDGVDASLKTLIGAIVTGGSADFSFKFEGSLELIAIHPNDFYEATTNVPLTAQDTLDDNGNNIWNIVETSLGINPSNQMDVMELGFFTAKMLNFGLQTMSLNLKMGISGSVGDLDANFNQFNTGDALTALQGLNGTVPSLSSSGDVNLLHVPTPLTVGAASVFFSAGPLIEADGALACFVGATLTSGARVDIQLGHLDLHNILNSPILTLADLNPFNIIVPEVALFEAGTTNSGADLFSDIVVTGNVGGSGQASLRLGANVGMSVGAGEPTTSGIAAGFIAPIGIEASLCGEGVFSKQLYPFDNEGGSFSGHICGDIKAGIFDIATFTDANLQGSDLADFFDYTMSLANLLPGFPDLSFSLLQGAEGYTAGNGDDCSAGICFENSECTSISVETFNLGILDNDDLELEFKFLNPEPVEFELVFRKDGGDEVSLPGTYMTGVLYQDISWDAGNELVTVAGAVVGGELVIKPTSNTFNCEKAFPNAVINTSSSNCSNPFEASFVEDDIHSYVNPVGQTITYHKYDPNADYPNLGAVTNFIANQSGCVNTSGFFIKDADGFKHGNASQNYTFISVADGRNELLEFSIEYDSEGNAYCDCEFATYSEDIYAPKIQF